MLSLQSLQVFAEHPFLGNGGILMNKEIIRKMQSQFDSLARIVPDEGVEFWFARDLQEPLGYARWENFIATIERAIASCETAG